MLVAAGGLIAFLVPFAFLWWLVVPAFRGTSERRKPFCKPLQVISFLAAFVGTALFVVQAGLDEFNFLLPAAAGVVSYLFGRYIEGEHRIGDTTGMLLVLGIPTDGVALVAFSDELRHQGVLVYIAYGVTASVAGLMTHWLVNKRFPVEERPPGQRVILD